MKWQTQCLKKEGWVSVMKFDQEVILIMVFGVVVFAGMFSVKAYELNARSTCKQLAIEHNMPYLEIKELCK